MINKVIELTNFDEYISNKNKSLPLQMISLVRSPLRT